MILRKLVAIVIAVVIALGIMSIMVFAGNSGYCQILENGKQCGNPIMTVYTGRSIDYADSHKYGGFLGIGAKTCNYQYYYQYYKTQCTGENVINTYSFKIESGHVCGQ